MQLPLHNNTKKTNIPANSRMTDTFSQTSDFSPITHVERRVVHMARVFRLSRTNVIGAAINRDSIPGIYLKNSETQSFRFDNLFTFFYNVIKFVFKLYELINKIWQHSVLYVCLLILIFVCLQLHGIFINIGNKQTKRFRIYNKHVAV